MTDQLPVEIWHEICQHLRVEDKKYAHDYHLLQTCRTGRDKEPSHRVEDLRNLRLCCRFLNEVASKWLFRGLVLHMNHSSLTTIQKIMKSPLASLPRILIIGCDHSPEYTFEEYVQCYRERVAPKILYHFGIERFSSRTEFEDALTNAHRDLGDEEYLDRFAALSRQMAHWTSPHKLDTEPIQRGLRLAYPHYQKLAQEASEMMGSSLRKTLSQLFLACPLLQSVRLSFEPRRRTFRDCTSDKRYEKGLLYPGSCHKLKHQKGHVILTRFFQAAHDTQRCFQQLDFQCISKRLMEADRRVLPVIRNTKTLSLATPVADSFGSLEKRAVVHSLNTHFHLVLNQASQTLQHLKIDVWPWCRQKPHKMARFGLIFRTEFPNLETLFVRSVSSTGREIEDFLLRHSKTLKAICLTNVVLSEGRDNETLQRLEKLPLIEAPWFHDTALEICSSAIVDGKHLHKCWSESE